MVRSTARNVGRRLGSQAAASTSASDAKRVRFNDPALKVRFSMPATAQCDDSARIARGGKLNGISTASPAGIGPDTSSMCTPASTWTQSTPFSSRVAGRSDPPLATRTGRQPSAEPGSGTATVARAWTVSRIDAESSPTSKYASAISAQRGAHEGAASRRRSSSSRISGDGVSAANAGPPESSAATASSTAAATGAPRSERSHRRQSGLLPPKMSRANRAANTASAAIVANRKTATSQLGAITSRMARSLSTGPLQWSS